MASDTGEYMYTLFRPLYISIGVLVTIGISCLMLLVHDSRDLPIAVGCSLTTIVFIGLAFYRLRINPPDDGQFKLTVINTLAAILHLLSACVLAWLAFQDDDAWQGPATATRSIWYRTGTEDAQCSPKDPCYIEFFTRVLPTKVPVATLAASFGLISGLGHGVVLLLNDDQLQTYVSEVYEGRNLFRWVDYAFSSSTMIVVIAIVTGVSEVYTLTSIAFGQALLMVLSYVIEVDLTTQGRFERGRTLFCIACVVYVCLVWTPIIGQFYDRTTPEAQDATTGSGTLIGDPPTWVNAVIWGLFSIFSCFAVVMYVYLIMYAGKTTEWYLRQELTYTALSLTAKTVLHWTLYMGISSRSDTVFNTPEEAKDSNPSDTTDNDVLQPVLIIGGVFILLGFLFYGFIRWYTRDRTSTKSYMFPMMS